MTCSVEAPRRNQVDWKVFLSGELAGARAHFEKCVGVFHQQKQLHPTAAAVSPSDNKENSSPFLFQGKTLSNKYFLQFLTIQDQSPIEPSQSPEFLRGSLEHPGFMLSCTSSARGLTQLPMFISRLCPLIFHLYCCGQSSSEVMSEESLQVLTGGREQHISFNDRRENVEPFRGAESGATERPAMIPGIKTKYLLQF